MHLPIGLLAQTETGAHFALTTLDWLVVAAYFVFNLAIGLYYRRRATKSTEEFFAGGRKVSWWLAGTSMVATTFAADTPLAVTGLVALYGIAGNWLWWNMLLSGMMTVFFFARLWRRARVLTDVEFAEIRYGGKPAAFLRGFRALYLGLPINCIVMGWVNLAMVTILTVIFPNLSIPFLGITDPKLSALFIVFAIMLVTASISALSGLWGVLVTDLFQFVLKMGMVIVLAYFAVHSVGGMEALKTKLLVVNAAKGGHGSIMSFIPDVGSAWMPLLTFFVYLAVTWWSTWYPGAEPGGGGFIAQRMFCAKDEKNSLLATLWFNIAHYAIRPWPWILTALVSVVLYPALKHPEEGFVRVVVDQNVFPVALRGLMIAAFAAAYMSTIATQLNWGASYLINDLYRRFMAKGRAEGHYVRAGQVATLGLMVVSCLVTYKLESIGGAWKFLMTIGAGTGGVYILRWFWWRINAWSEISTMLASLVAAGFLELFLKLDSDKPLEFAYIMLITVAFSTIVWVAVTLLTAPEDKQKLLAFYRRVHPSAALWGPIAREATDVPPRTDGLHNLLDWAMGCLMVYMTLFGVGKIIFGEAALGFGFLAIAVVAAVVLWRDLSQRGWRVLDDAPTEEAPAEQPA